MQKFIKNHYGALIAWLLAVLIAVVMLPNITQLVHDKGQTELPDSAESKAADLIQDDWGYGQGNTRQIVAIFSNGDDALSVTQQKAVKQTIKDLRKDKKKYGIKNIMAPNDNAETKKQLISKDKTTQIVQLLVDKDHGSVTKVNNELVKAVKTTNVKTYVTGADILNNEFDLKTQRGIQKTEIIAAVFIFIVLILVFRSPVVPVISLLTVAVSFITALSIVTNLVDKFNFPFSNFTEVFMVVVLFGIGTDYNILLYDQFKEDLSAGMSNWEATKAAQHKAGRTILYSGSSILIGFSVLGLANFSIYRSAVGVAIGVVILLAVLLTLNPFFMTLLGKKMFWPSKNFDGHSTSKLWGWLSAKSVLHPLIALGIVLITMLPFAFTYSNNLNYDNLQELGDDVAAKRGFEIVEKHFSKGTAEPTTLYIQSDHTLDNETDLKTIDELTKALQKVKGVKMVSSVTQPGGSAISKLYVRSQVKTLGSGVNDAQDGLKTINNGLTSAADQIAASDMQSGLDGVQQLIDGTGTLKTGSSAVTDGVTQLQAGSQQLADGMTLMNQQLSSQLSGSNASQIAQLQAALPQLNAGIQQLNSALQSADTSGIDLSGLSTTLSTVETKLNDVGSQLTSAGTTLNALPADVQNALASVNTGSTETSTQVAQIIGAAQQNGAALSAAQQQILTAVLTSVLDSSKDQIASSQAELQQKLTAVLTASLTSVKGNLQTSGADLKAVQAATAPLKEQFSSEKVAQLQQMLAQVAQMKQAVQQLASGSNVALPGAVQALNQLTSGLTKVQTAVASGSNGANQLNSGLTTLASKTPQLTSGLTTLQNGEQQMYAQLGSTVEQMSELQTGLTSATGGLTTISTGLKDAQDYLDAYRRTSAAKVFYIPKEQIHGDEFSESLKTYLSEDKKTAKLTIILSENPSSDKAMTKVRQLSTQSKNKLKGTSLGDAKVALGGQTSQIADIQEVASADFTRTALIMVVGIGIALMFVTRSILQPFFILGTLLMAFFTSLGITRWISATFMGHDMLTWNTPFFTFIMIFALGVDYSIFLMMKYREFGIDDINPTQRIVKASGIIGAVVISAAIILSGTFAALMPSGVLTLIQVALAVIIGLVLLIFMLPVVLPAAIHLTYDRKGKDDDADLNSK